MTLWTLPKKFFDVTKEYDPYLDALKNKPKEGLN